MSSETKKIVVNLDVVKPTKQAKTRKNIVPKIPPNSIKNELLRKIKQTRQNGETKTVHTQETDEYTDEFCKSIQYLNEVKQKMNNVAKTRKNVSNISNVGSPNAMSSAPNLVSNPNRVSPIANANNYVHLELPDDLEEFTPGNCSQPQTPIQNIVLKPTTNTSGHHNQTSKVMYNVDNVVPHGCLKNGIKPCFRNWKTNQTRKNTGFEENAMSSRELQLQRLKQSFATAPSNSVAPIQSSVPVPTPMIAPASMPDYTYINETPKHELHNNDNNDNNNNDNNVNNNNNVQLVIDDTPPQPKKTFIKKTTIKKHTIGKSTKYRRVGVLLKNKLSRKQVIDAQRELKKTPIHEIKKILRKQGLIKVGSTAPNDVIKETYESAVLAGEITNKNSDVLFHNFMNDKKED
jgi:hypothetical protein